MRRGSCEMTNCSGCLDNHKQAAGMFEKQSAPLPIVHCR